MSKRAAADEILQPKTMKPRTVLEISPTPEILTLQPEDLFKSRVELTCLPADLGTIEVRIPCQPTDGYFDTFAKVQGFLDGIGYPKEENVWYDRSGSLNWVFSPPPAESRPTYHTYTLVGGKYAVKINDGNATNPYSVYTELGLWRDGSTPSIRKRTIVISKVPDYPTLSGKIEAYNIDQQGVLLIFANGPPDTLPTQDEFKSINGLKTCSAQYYLTKDGKNRINYLPWYLKASNKTAVTFQSFDNACPVKELNECIRAIKKNGTHTHSVGSFFHLQRTERKRLASFWKQIPEENKTCSEMSFVGIALKCALCWWALNDIDAEVVITSDAASFGEQRFGSSQVNELANDSSILDPEMKNKLWAYLEHQATFLGIELRDLLQRYQEGGYYKARFGINSGYINNMHAYSSKEALPIHGDVYDGIKAAFVDRCLVFQ